ncbi:hypothetical protein [Ottowia testudinis]|uniref:Uncharacterized protein n=1 Tax=Ottowia testudinis TaxID=2816950 RepID=A0A975H236_9BURK|nr:hypothetical protein [Ottowia testudinis]QTD43786.1 hypothetical protein J1M35_11525 [Ottowia testudinis]
MDDDTPPRTAPRFVPTLTEVVGAAHPAAARAAPASASGAAAPPTAPIGAAAVAHIADAMLQRLGPGLERQIAEAVGRVLHEQMLGFNPRVQKAVAEVVRDAVAKALTQDAHGTDPGGNP